MSVDQWIIFLIACTVLNTTPGPDSIYITARTISQGKLSGIVSSLGVCSGAVIHALAAGAGLSVILATSAYAFTVVKWLGAIFLIYLGLRAIISTLKSNRGEIKPTQDLKETALWKVYVQGILVDLLNPKTALFFLAFIPQFINKPDLSSYGESSFWPFIILGMVLIANALVVEILWVFLAARVTRYFRSNQSISTWLERCLGVTLIAVGFRLAREKL